MIGDLDWYLRESSSKGTPTPRWPFANADHCPRYFQSLSLLGGTGFTGLSANEEKRLLKKWTRSALWPRTAEQATSISGSETKSSIFSNFCPEVLFDGFGLFATVLSRYADELDLETAHARLATQDADRNDWRWQWSDMIPMHYSACPLYSVLANQKSIVKDQMARSTEKTSTRTEKDLFVSYSSKDKPFVERLAADLIRHGMKIWVDTFEMRIGDSLNKNIQQGISKSGWLGIVLSPDSVASPWVEKELNAALELELEKQSVFVLPLFYRECNIPLFLRDKLYADFRNSYEAGLEALLRKIKPAFEPSTLNILMSGSIPAIKAAFSDVSPEARNLYEARLREFLNSSSVGERIAATTALFAIHHKEAFVYLVQMASDSSASVRRFAIYYLGELRSRKALAILSERMSDPSSNVRTAARDAFKKIPGARE